MPLHIRTPDGRHLPHWDDIRIVPGAFQFAGASDPSLKSWQPGGAGATYKVYAFQSGNEVFFTVQMPHAYIVGTPLYFHVHWTPADRGVAEDTKTVAWKVDYSIADFGKVFPASTTLDLTDTCDGVDDKHLNTGSVIIAAPGITGISAMLVCRLYRDAGDTWVGVTVAQSPVLLEVDIHYRLDAPGSKYAWKK